MYVFDIVDSARRLVAEESMSVGESALPGDYTCIATANERATHLSHLCRHAIKFAYASLSGLARQLRSGV